jgi:hypothetical protein
MTDEDKIERYEEALRRIVEWSEAYPLKVFPEPDWKRAGDLLRAGGINLDVISASICATSSRVLAGSPRKHWTLNKEAHARRALPRTQ